MCWPGLQSFQGSSESPFTSMLTYVSVGRPRSLQETSISYHVTCSRRLITTQQFASPRTRVIEEKARVSKTEIIAFGHRLAPRHGGQGEMEERSRPLKVGRWQF